MNNREILFRGKQLNIGQRSVTASDEWVYGYYVCDSISTYIYSTLHNPKMVSVDHKTVGQYTGLTDKNGKKIFEGDILKRQGTRQTMLYTVNWNQKFAMFILPCVTHEIMENDFMSLTGDAFEVIGNIYDNPELIGGN